MHVPLFLFVGGARDRSRRRGIPFYLANAVRIGERRIFGFEISDLSISLLAVIAYRRLSI